VITAGHRLHGLVYAASVRLVAEAITDRRSGIDPAGGTLLTWRHFGANRRSPRQLPVGALTALIGCPCFLF